jgi:hypothetical protein
MPISGRGANVEGVPGRLSVSFRARSAEPKACPPRMAATRAMFVKSIILKCLQLVLLVDKLNQRSAVLLLVMMSVNGVIATPLYRTMRYRIFVMQSFFLAV